MHLQKTALVISFCVLSNVSFGAAISDTDSLSDTKKLIQAIETSDLATVSLLLQEQPSTKIVSSALKHSMRHISMDQYLSTYNEAADDRLGIKKALIAAGASQKAKNFALLKTVTLCQPATLEALLASGADVNDIDPETGDTPLISALRSRQKFTALRLLQVPGCKVNKINPKDGTSPLLWSVADKIVSVTEALLAKGADPAYETQEGETALSLSLKNKYYTATEVLLSPTVIPLLQEEQLSRVRSLFVTLSCLNKRGLFHSAGLPRQLLLRLCAETIESTYLDPRMISPEQIKLFEKQLLGDHHDEYMRWLTPRPALPAPVTHQDN